MAKTDPDHDLLPGLQNGQETALAKLMDRHLKTITAIGFYMLGDTSLAEDVAQSTFLKLWQIAPNWKPGQATSNWKPGQATLLTWMRRVATNDCLDRLRKKRPIYSDNVPEQTDKALSPLESLQMGDTQRHVREALWRGDFGAKA